MGPVLVGLQGAQRGGQRLGHDLTSVDAFSPLDGAAAHEQVAGQFVQFEQVPQVEIGRLG
jgi:hypothetical protein